MGEEKKAKIGEDIVIDLFELRCSFLLILVLVTQRNFITMGRTVLYHTFAGRT